MAVVIYGEEIEVGVGSIIKPDGWRFAQTLEPSRWDAAQFCLPTSKLAGITHLSVNITVTGRTYQRREDDYWVRVKIEFVGDCEPSIFHSGWMKRTW